MSFQTTFIEISLDFDMEWSDRHFDDDSRQVA